MLEEDMPLCFTTECNFNDGGDCTIDPKDCPYLESLAEEFD